MLPSDSRFPQFRFTVFGFELCIALMDYDTVAYPDIVYPVLLKKVSTGVWEKIDERQLIWNDQKQDFEHEFMAKLIIDDFNQTILKLDSGIPMSYNEKLAASLANDYTIKNNQLVKKV